MNVMIPFYFMANRGGIPRVKSESVTVTATEVRFNFTSDARFARNFSGFVAVWLAQAIPSGTTGTLPVVFSSTASSNQAVTTFDDTAVTVNNISGTGIYLAYYEASTGTLQLLTGLA